MKVYTIGIHGLIYGLIATTLVAIALASTSAWRAHEATVALHVALERERESRQLNRECRDILIKIEGRMHVYEELFGIAKSAWQQTHGTGGAE